MFPEHFPYFGDVLVARVSLVAVAGTMADVLDSAAELADTGAAAAAAGDDFTEDLATAAGASDIMEADSGVADDTADTPTVAEEASDDVVIMVTSCCAKALAPDVSAVTNTAATRDFVSVVIVSRSRERPGQLM